MILPHIVDSLWWLLIAIECLALCTALARKVHEQYPLFVIYVAFACVRSFTLRALLNNDVGYFYVWWITAVFGDILLVGVMVELGRLLFAPYWIIPLEPKRAFHFCLSSLLGVSILLPLVLRSKGEQLDWYYFLNTFARTMNRSVNLMIFGTMLLGIVLSIYLSIPWRRVATYLAAGLLMKFGVETWLWFCLLDAPRQKVMSLQWVTLSASILSFGIWMAACFVPEHDAVSLTEEQLDSLEHFVGFAPLQTSSKELT